MKEMAYRTKGHTERGTPTSDYGCCCFLTKTPRNDSTGSKLLFGTSKTCTGILGVYFKRLKDVGLSHKIIAMNSPD
jgi:hypothetical protein